MNIFSCHFLATLFPHHIERFVNKSLSPPQVYERMRLIYLPLGATQGFLICFCIMYAAGLRADAPHLPAAGRHPGLPHLFLYYVCRRCTSGCVTSTCRWAPPWASSSVSVTSLPSWCCVVTTPAPASSARRCPSPSSTSFSSRQSSIASTCASRWRWTALGV